MTVQGTAGVSDAALKVAMLMPCAGAMQGRPSGSLRLCKLKQKKERSGKRARQWAFGAGAALGAA